ncbi:MULTISPECIES: EthD family reductase [unclassified Bradyrhizobium]|uniref:EthD family reductase n=1 Tax=unclassified Bradyrhizobium TaxID=2631580 RepID=UPI001CD5CC85|nr:MULTISPECIES: EthD family reductase [unclassified Bradyrhizobium]MCA1373002.1 EthD family reductase [Bradyrhizobium sp. IC4060]MCA1482273.1 EthD family reductase [Bradyrhizobium sp. IC4061]MCA1538940.1 EthD family reductase [Bradyrhizobium sp. NBAIM32]
MHCLTVLYPTPDDPSACRAYYVDKHVPLAATLPGLVRHHYAFPQRLGPGEAPFCIFQAFFPDAAAMDAALGSEIGRKVAADVPNYSPKGATLCHFKIEGA